MAPIPRGSAAAAVAALAILAAAACGVDAQVVTVDWATTLRALQTRPTLQVVVNPLLDRSWPTSARAFQQLSMLWGPNTRNLGAVRLVPWYPYYVAAVPEREPPSGTDLCLFANGANDDWHSNHSFTLSCAGAGTIASVDFVNYGSQAGGFCSNLTHSACFVPGALAQVQGLCVGKPSCDLYSMDTFFNGGVDPCPNIPKTLAVRAQCSDSSVMHSYWDSAAADAQMEDFMAAMGHSPNGTTGADVLINFSTEPYWMWATGGNRVPYADDPMAQSGGPPGTALVDPTGAQLGAYYGRLVSWYTQGGFTDEYGVWHASPYHYNITAWECLNEMEHGLNPETYLPIYDAMVAGIRAVNFTGQFAALALGGLLDPATLAFFTNASNHNPPSTPVDWLTFHNYPGCADSATVSSCESVFASADQLGAVMAAVTAERDAVAPHVKLSIDELGIFTGLYPLPDSYWNVACAFHAYVWGLAALVGMDAIGASQLVGSPAFPGTDVGWQVSGARRAEWAHCVGRACGSAWRRGPPC
jgi:hypothetical protein